MWRELHVFDPLADEKHDDLHAGDETPCGDETPVVRQPRAQTNSQHKWGDSVGVYNVDISPQIDKVSNILEMVVFHRNVECSSPPLIRGNVHPVGPQQIRNSMTAPSSASLFKPLTCKRPVPSRAEGVSGAK